jgi:hypothetical protein
MSTVTPIVAPPYTSEQYVEHRDILPVTLVDTETGRSTSPVLQDLSDALVANTVKVIVLPTTTSYLRIQNSNASGDIVFRFNVAPTIGDYKSITLAPGAVFELKERFKATDIEILRATNGNFNLIVV